MAKDLDDIINAFEKIRSGEIYNQVGLTIHQQIKKRIFTEGKNAKDKKIGRYSQSTLEIRKNVKTKGGKKRVPQSKFIILEFTGDMRKDFSPIKDKGVIVGSGFKRKINAQKRKWVEKRLKQKIFAMTRSEQDLFSELLTKHVKEILS